ncbi:amino acid permease protein [Apiospora aurea]|uniref:Amino acid permease protein n=1 Tax=Apiospora aurea TaxID=335848 RepID=A0ABR1QAF1_9PEZI
MTWFTAAWVITGWNAASAVAEETHNARSVAPRFIVTTYCPMSIMGSMVCVLLAFCILDIEAAALGPSGSPAFALLIQRRGRTAGVAFSLLAFLNTAIGGGAAPVTVSCQTAAFARDGGLLNMPVRTCMLLTDGGILMLCLASSPVASGTIYSLAFIAVMVLYALPMAFRIPGAGEGGRRWVPGPWDYCRLSVPIHVAGLVTVLYMTTEGVDTIDGVRP